MYRGYVKAWRAMKDHHLWKHGTPHQRSIIMALLWMASHKEKSWYWKGEKFTIKPGQMITSLESIMDDAGDGTTLQSVRSALQKFKKFDFITEETTKTGRLITITNWILYQSDNMDDNIGDNKGTTDEQHSNNIATTPIKNVRMEECKNGDKIKPCVSIETLPTPADIKIVPLPVVDKPKRHAKEPTGEHNQTIRYFTDCWEKKNGTKYPYQSGQDSVAMKNLLSHYQPEKVRAMIDLYLSDTNPFLQKKGWSLSWLWHEASGLAIRTESNNGGREEIDYDEAARPKHLRRDGNAV